MAAVTMTEKDFDALVCAALDAQDRGDMETAKVLDKIARKLNAAITVERYRSVRVFSGSAKSHTWRDVPSVLVQPDSKETV